LDELGHGMLTDFGLSKDGAAWLSNWRIMVELRGCSTYTDCLVAVDGEVLSRLVFCIFLFGLKIVGLY